MHINFRFTLILLLLTAAAATGQSPAEQLARWRTAYFAGNMLPSAVADSCKNLQRQLPQNSMPVLIADLWSLWGNALSDQGRHEPALDAHQKALAIRRKISSPALQNETANSWQNIGNCYFDLNLIEQAGQAYQKAWNIKRKLFHPLDSNLINTSICLGNYYFCTNDVANADQFYQAALEAARNNFGPNSPKLGTPLLALAEFERSQQHYKEAEQLLYELLNIEEKSGAPARKKIADCRLNLMNLAIEMPDYTKAVQEGELAANLLSAAEYPTERGTCLHNLAMAWRELGDPKRALQYGYECLPLIQIAYKRTEHLILVATIHNDLGQSEEARRILQMAYTEAGFDPQFRAEHRTEIHTCEGDICHAQQDWTAAIRAYDAGINVAQQIENIEKKSEILGHLWLKRGLSLLENQQIPAAMQSIEKARTQAQTQVLLQCLIEQALGQCALAEKDYKRAVKQFEAALSILHGSRQQYLYEQCELDMKRAQAILFQTRLDFGNLSKQELRMFFNGSSGVPPHHTYHQAATSARQTLLKLAASMPFGEGSYDLRHNFFPIYGIGVEFAFAMDDMLLALNWSESSRLTGGETISTLEGFKTLPILKSDESVLCYHWAADRLFGFLIDSKGIRGEVLSQDIPALEEKIATFYGLCSTHPNDIVVEKRDSMARLMADLGHELYQILVQPFGQNIGKNLSIVPDGLLHYVPFEALISELVASPHLYQKHPYLLHQYTINYNTSLHQRLGISPVKAAEKAPSATQEHLNKEKTSIKGDVIAIAPLFVGRNKGLDSLRYNQPEADTIARMTNGHLLAGAAARKDSVRRLLPQYRIVHFSTHGFANVQHPTYSFIACSDVAATDGAGQDNYQFYVAELGQIRLDNTELFVLSACQTAMGKLRRGEGLLSIAHAIERTGADALIASLWNVDDQNTPGLMRRLYEELSKGLAKNTALANAKRMYMRSLPGSERLRAHPFFWAGFVLTGDPAPLSMYAPSPWWMLVLPWVLGGMLVFWLIRRLLPAIRQR